MNELSRLKPPAGATKKRKRKGRGLGSGNGKTAGKGQKGQKARSGGSVPPGFEGGQMPLHRRLPKGGFKNRFRVEYAAVNVSQLNQFEDGAVVDLDTLIASGMVKRNEKLVKLLGHGELTKKLTIRVNKASATAQEKVAAAGGTIEVIGG